MATIYEMTDEYLALLELAEDPEVDPETLEGTLEALDGEIEEKADGYAKVMKQLEANVAALRAEEKRLSTKRTTCENNMKRMKQALQYAMEATGKTKFKTDLFSFGIQKNPAAVVIDEQYIENIPEEYLIPQEPKIDKTKMKEDLKAGKDLEGICHLEQTESLRIR